MRNQNYCAMMHNYVIALIYNLCMTLFFIFCSINCLQDCVLVKINYIHWLKKWTKSSLSHQRMGSNHNFKQFKDFCMSNYQDDES